MNRSLALLFGLLATITSLSGVGHAGVMLTSADIISTTYTPAQSNPDEQDILDYLELSSFGTLSGLGDLLFKWEQEDGESSSPLSSSYDVVGLLDDGKLGATIQYVVGDIVNTSNPAWLVVKGGKSGFVVYDLSGNPPVWDGKEDLSFTNAGLFGKQDQLQGISNVQIWGGAIAPPGTTPGPTPANGVVPEPTTMAIWSVMGLCGVGAARRKRGKKA